MAIEFNTAIILLAQLRKPEPGKLRRPHPDEIRDSGDIEAAADGILMTHLGSFYTGQEYLLEEQDKKDVLIICKNRFGKTGVAEMCWHNQYARWENLKR